MIRVLTAGETHGRALVAIIEGLPSNVPVDIDRINHQLKLRQGGYGRGGRMKIETDTAQILSGVRDNKTLGSPVALLIENKDHENWKEIMNAQDAVYEKVVTAPRAGHADLSGSIKYNHKDIRNVLERASARETAIRVAAGALVRQVIECFGIEVTGYVKSIGTVCSEGGYQTPGFRDAVLTSVFRFPDEEQDQAAIEYIDQCKREGESAGGVVEVVVTGVPAGIGSYVHYDRKLDANLAMAAMSVQSVKGVEFGLGFLCGSLPGSSVHDEIAYDGNEYRRKTNNAGGIEGGMSNGNPILLRAALKPIPTLYKPLASVDILTKKTVLSNIERSDICAVPAGSVVLENVVAFEIAKWFLDKFSGDSLEEVKASYESYKKHIKEF